MNRNKFYQVNYRAYLFVFITLMIIVGAMTHFILRSHMEDEYEFFQKTTQTIARNYTDRLEDASSATAVVTDLLDTRVRSIGEAILLQEELADNEILKQLARIYQVDEISFYDQSGKIIHSNVEEIIGWQVYEGHPVQKFLDSDETHLIEDLRRDTINGKFFKYGYVKTSEGFLIQVGIRADNIDRFYRQFRFQKVLDEMFEEESLLHAYFLNASGELSATTNSDLSELYLRRPGISDLIEEETVHMFETEFRRIPALHVSTPVFLDGEKMGTIVFLWSLQNLHEQTEEIVSWAIFLAIIVLILNAIIIVYAYRKDKSHVDLAYFDHLTGLPNREYLERVLEEMIVKNEHSKSAILLVNCAHFKTKNVTFGFKYGDEILKQIGNLLQSKSGSKHQVFRFNADRFIIYVEKYKDREELEDFAETIVRAFRLPFTVDRRQEYVDVEVAVLELNEHIKSTDTIFQEVNLALVSLKNTEQRIVFYADEMEHRVFRERQIEEHLRRIVFYEDQESLYLVYQPKLRIKDQRIDGFEALARMSHPELGHVSPLEFIEIAERELLIYSLGAVILDKACAFIAKLQENGITDQRIAVNISSKQLLREEFASDVGYTISKYGIPSELLEFEITETVFVDNFDLFNEKLKRLKSLGIQISLDDFGTGYSSFARLRELEINTLKIDKYFIDNILKRGVEELITGDIISMAHKLKLQVVAEGVETESQLAFLENVSCDTIQGYYFSKPLMEHHVTAFIKLHQDQNDKPQEKVEL